MAFIELPKPEDFNRLTDKQIETLDLHKGKTRKILELANILELSEQDYHERKEVHHMILHLLRKFYPNCELFIFGSSINGFGCKGCDLDLLFLPYPQYCNFNFKDVENESIPNPHTVLNNPHLRQKLLQMNETSQLKFVKKVLYTKSQVFSQVFLIPAKCPILNIKFADFDFECDLSASNKYVVCNSELLRLYGRLDSRVRPLIILLRYWAKSLGFIKKNLLSSYTFCFMVIFALQNTDPPVVPSVRFLSALAGFSSKINGWETAFSNNVELIPRSENTATIAELLLHFFEFYWDFDFVQNVVSPWTGKPWSIKDLKLSNDERLRNFPATTFSIQDPFILCNNISRNATMKTSFKMAILVGKECAQQDDIRFNTFFKSEYYERCLSPLHDFPSDLKYISKNCEIFSMSLTYDSFVKLGLTSSFLPWYEKMMQAVFDVLQYRLLMECEVIDRVFWLGKPPKKKRKKCVSPTSMKQLELIMSIQCTVYYDTWNKVAESNKKNELVKGLINKEYCISKQVVIETTKIKEPPLMIFQCNCFKFPVEQLSDMIVVLRPLTKSLDTHGLGKFLKVFIPRTVEKVINKT